MNAIRDRIPTVSWLPFSDDSDDIDGDDAETWNRQSRLSKLWTLMAVYPFLTISVLFFVFTLVLYLYPVVPSAHRSVGLVTIAGIVVAFSAWGLYNRIQAFQTLQRYTLHINFRGNSISPRLAVETDVDEDEIRGYKILRRFDLGGLITAYEEFRDRHARREISEHKEKYHRVSDDGSGEVVDGVLEPQTADTDTIRNDIQLFNNIAVTHTGRQKPNMDSKHIDSVSTIPPTIDSRTSAQVRSAFEKQALDRKHVRGKLDMLQQHVKEMEEYVDPAGQPLFENVIGTLETLNEIEKDDSRQRRSLQPTRRDENGGGYE